MNKNYLSFLVAMIMFCACNTTKTKVDLLVMHATIYTVDSGFSKTEGLAISNGKIVATGGSLDQLYDAKEIVDAAGKFIFPGFIDAHAHFLNYGQGLQSVDLVGTTSWEEILQRLQSYAVSHPDGWLVGRGWDQNDWQHKEFPDRQQLDSMFPSRPVFLSRVDGHAAIVNQEAIKLSGITADRKITGGDIIRQNGVMTGVLIDNAIDIVTAAMPAPSTSILKQALKDAEANCVAAGLTTVDDCGLDHTAVDLIRELQDAGELKMRLYVMLSDNEKNFNYLSEKGIIKTDRLNVRSFKAYADGALGSRGACLLKPYTDKPGTYGFLLSNREHFDSLARKLYDKGFQLCTHAIGDSGNRVILDTYSKLLQPGNDKRWRIEHAQVVSPSDFSKFGAFEIIPSVQPTHATSDMYWAADRLGKERVKGAYAFRQLLEQNGWIALGTDFPVEDINPLKTFFAAVVRKDTSGWPAAGFQPENALTREQALRGMTIWAAKANFEEGEKGSLEKNKFADFIILDQDLLTVPPEKILSVKVLATYINGQKVYDHQTRK